jgi:uncharacterized protein involved in exopolysaccharide biosynthesis
MDDSPLGRSSDLDLAPAPTGVYRIDGGTTARDVAAVLFRRKRIILALFFAIFAGVGVGAVWLVPWLFPPRYAAGLKFILKKDRFDALVTPADRAVPGLTTTITPEEVQSEIELLKSADVMERLAREARVSPEHLERGLVAGPVVVGRSFTNLIAVRYSSPDPAEIVRVLDKLPELYLAKYLSVNRRPGAVEYFRSQTEAYEGQLRQAQDDVAEFEKQQPGLGEESFEPRARQKLADIEKQKWETEAAVRDADSRTIELARQLAGLPRPDPAPRRLEESPYLGRLKSQLLELENRRAEATLYREIEQLDRRIAELRKTVEVEAQRGNGPVVESASDPLRADVEGELMRSRALLAGLRARRASLAEQERSCREEVTASRLISAENAGQRAELLRNVKSAEESFLLYRRKYAEAQEAENLDQKRVLNVALAESPRPPAPVEKRSTWFYLGLGLVLAAAGGAAGGFAADLLDRSIHTPRQLERCSSLVVLACIPESPVR